MEQIEDEKLMQQVKEGNISVMSVLFERYHVQLYNFFLRLTADRETSQDLTQNLFYRMIKYKNSYKCESGFKPWMYRMARNLHIDYCNSEKRSREVLTVTGEYPSDPSDDVAATEEDYMRLEKAFSVLSDEQREVIVMSRYQGLKYEDISRITNQSVPAIKVTVHRAIKKLRETYFNSLKRES